MSGGCPGKGAASFLCMAANLIEPDLVDFDFSSFIRPFRNFLPYEQGLLFIHSQYF
jgi:hypothetical protein